MNTPSSGAKTKRKQPDESSLPKYVLKLYVTGTTPRSLRAIANIKNICEDYLKGRYNLVVIDIYTKPKLAAGEQIIASPTLIKKLPSPLRRFVGDLSDTEKILLGLDIQQRGRPAPKKKNIPRA